MSPNGDPLVAVRDARDKRDQARERLYALDLQRLRLERQQRRDSKGSGGTEGEQLEGEIAAQRKAVAASEARLVDELATFRGSRTPQELIESWPDDLPILLLPLRVETRWKLEPGSRPELWVRVFPDDVARVTHEKVLTDAEVEHGRAYWARLHVGAADAREEAWTALAERFGSNRAAWVARETKPDNWDAAGSDPTATLHFADPTLTKPDAWTTAPHTRVLPDRLVLMAWRGEELVAEELSEPIDDVVVLGPSPLEDHEGAPSISRDEADQTLKLGEAFEWVRDFDKAVASGLGFRVRLDPDDVAAGFDRLVVIGVKYSADADDTKALVEDLLDNHHYSLPGLSLVPQGTPTNNTDGNDSAYVRAGRDADQSEATETGLPRFSPRADRTVASDGQRLADLLGISYDPLLHVDGAGLEDNADAVAMNRALYAGTLGYYFDHMLNEVLDEDGFEALRDHFTEHVTGRGPLPSIRVGAQPYGILPTSAFARWGSPSHGTATHLPRGARFEALLHAVLGRFDRAWQSLTPRLAQVGTPGDGAAHLLDVLGLQPTSAEFYQRVGYSWDYLRNLDDFAFDGDNFGDVIKMMVESAVTRQFLVELGYDDSPAEGRRKSLPLLLQLIWRHYHDELDAAKLIDSQPLSETAEIKPYDSAHSKDNYIDWLHANAGDADKLEAEDFGGPAAPGTLLYMMLRFSLLMESKRALFSWLTARGVESEMLIRSRKFMNIGPAPSPSPWEVFRTPANLLVPSESSSEPLLQMIYLPQFSTEEGRYVQLQLDALTHLRGLSTARLERALTEHLDTLSYRLDAWQTSLFARRLHRQRKLDEPPEQRRTGLFLGAYGFLENLRPARERREKISEDRLPPPLRTGEKNLYSEIGSGGYVHAPSLNHATAAALLRSGYLTHATPDQPEALAVNLSSDRVRRARYLLQGIQNGQSLETLLGVQFERGLHDWTTRPNDPVFLDQLKPAFRQAFPIRRTRVPQAADAADGAGLVSEDHQVVNGLDLALTEKAYPYDVSGLSELTPDQQNAIKAEKEKIENTLDSLHDVLTAEAAYQLALGNFDRAAAIVRSTGESTVPPDVEVLRTPRGSGIAFTQRLAVSFLTSVTANPWPGIPFTPRARLEPALNHWVGDLLGDPATIHCQVSAVDGKGHVLTIGGAPAEGPVTLADLGVQPLDFVYMVRRQVEESGLAELEARVRYSFARGREVPDDAVVKVAFADAGAGPPARPFSEALALGDRIRQLLGAARPLSARHFESPSKDAPAPVDNPERIDLPELRGRVGTWLTDVRALFPELKAAVDAAIATPSQASADALRAALLKIADAGFVYALPRSAVGAAAAQIEALIQQGESILARSVEVGEKTDALLAQVDTPEGGAERKASDLTAAVRGWAGEDFILMPRFAFGDPAGVASADADRAKLLAYAKNSAGIPLPVREWLHGAACVRPLVHNFELLRTIAETSSGKALQLAPLQLPHRPDDSWLGTQYPAGMEIVHDTVSLAQHLPQGFDASAPQCGLLIDEWVEVVPKREEITGLSFNFNAPNSAPPQALLLAVAPEETGHWSWDELVDTVLDTFRRAKLRAVEPDAIGDLPAIGTLLPAVMAEFSTGASTISLDYLFIFDSVRLLAKQLATEVTGPGG